MVINIVRISPVGWETHHCATLSYYALFLFAETMGPDAAAFAFDSSSSSTSKRKSTSMHGQTRKKKTRFEATLEAFTKAMDSTKDDELLREMQREQHAHEERMLDRMTQSITSIISTVASAQHPPVQGPPNPCYFMPHSGNTGHHQNAPFNPPRQTSQLDEDNSNGLIHLSPSTCRVEPAGFTPLDPSVKVLVYHSTRCHDFSFCLLLFLLFHIFPFLHCPSSSQVKTESDDSPPSQNSLELDSITP